MVKAKETAKEGGNGKSKAANKKRDVNNRLVGILCRDKHIHTVYEMNVSRQKEDIDGDRRKAKNS
jgi:hypothetical protein